MKTFILQIFSFLDKSDKLNFIWFIIGLFLNGAISLLGIGSVIPLIIVLMNPNKLRQIPYIGSLSFPSQVGCCVTAMIIAFVLKNSFNFFILFQQSSFQSNLSAKIRKKLFSSYLNAEFIFHKQSNSTSLVNNVCSQIQALTNNVIVQFGTILTEFLTATIIIGTVFFIKPSIVLYLVLSIICSITGFMLIMRQQTKKFDELRAENLSIINQLATNALGGIKETKLYHKEQYFTDKFDINANLLKNMESFTLISQQSSRLILETIGVSIMLVTIYILVLSGDTAETLMLTLSIFALIAAQLLPSMNRLVNSLSRIYISAPLLNQMYVIINEIKLRQNDKVSTDIEQISFKTQFRLENISFNYGNKNILQNISLTIPYNAKIALVGKSGAGKSTLADVIMCLLQPSSGEIFIDNVKLSINNQRSWQNLFAYVPQDIFIYNSTIAQNIMCYQNYEKEAEDQILAALDFAGLSEWIKLLPDGIHTKVGEHGQFLSGGQKRRVGIARAIFQSPKILVMDEATNGLDLKTEDLIMQSILEKSITVITITHRLDLLKNYDQIYVIQDQTISASGTYIDLVKNCGFFNKNSIIK